MGVNDVRDRPAYRPWNAKPEWALNPHILRWWGAEQDALITAAVERWQWSWPWFITDRIVECTDPDTLTRWREQDPKCQTYAWYNVLMYFAIARADTTRLSAKVRPAEWRTCPLCGERFIESSVPAAFVARLGADQLDFCSPCLGEALFDGSEDPSPGEVQEYLRRLAEALERVPSQGVGLGAWELSGLSTEQRMRVLRVLMDKPSVAHVKALYGSWLRALIEAGVLPDGTLKASRGIQCIANDGHVCLSLGEKTIDDLLYASGIAHRREVAYPDGQHRVDFAVGNVFIEFFGMTGDAEYDKRTTLKKALCHEAGIPLVAVYPKDLAGAQALEKKILTDLGRRPEAIPKLPARQRR